MKTFNKILVISAVLMMAGCTSSKYGETVIQEKGACGSWVDSGKPSFRKGDDWYFIGQTRLTSMRSNRAQGFRIAENSAKTLIANKINQVLSSEFQNVEEGTDLDSNQVKYISTEASKMIASNIDSDERCSQRIMDRATGAVYEDIYVKVKINDVDLKDAISRTMEKKGITKELKEQALKDWGSVRDMVTPE